MHSPEEVIIYLDVFIFVSLIAFFAILFKSKSLFIKKKWQELNIREQKEINLYQKLKKIIY